MKKMCANYICNHFGGTNWGARKYLGENVSMPPPVAPPLY